MLGGALAATLALPASVRAQPPSGVERGRAEAEPEVGPTLEEDVAHIGASSAVDPTEPLMQLALRAEWDPVLHGEPGRDRTRVFFRPTIPFAAWGLENILRVSIPYVAEGADEESGLGPVEAYDAVILPLGPGRVGVGATMRLAPDLGQETRFAAGPLLGYVVQLGPLVVGGYTQTFLGDESETVLIPILALTLAPWLSVGVGELEIQWLWDDARFESIPIGLAVDVVAELAGQYLRFSFNPQYGVHDVEDAFEWRLAAQVALLAR